MPVDDAKDDHPTLPGEIAQRSVQPSGLVLSGDVLASAVPHTGRRRLPTGPPGRPVGAKGVASKAAKRVARRLVTDPAYVAKLRARLIEGNLPAHMESLLWAYAYGKPRQDIDVNQSSTLTIQVLKAWD